MVSIVKSKKVINVSLFFIVTFAAIVYPFITSSASISIGKKINRPWFLAKSLNVTLVDEKVGYSLAPDKTFHYNPNIITRIISINGTNITVAGFTVNLNYSWRDIDDNITRSFDAIWVHMALQEDYLPIKEVYRCSLKKNITFASNYNGTHFSEAIINGTAGSWGYPGYQSGGGYVWIRELNKSYVHVFVYSALNINFEINRTEYHGDTIDSIYNPSFAILAAHNYLKQHNFTYDNVTEVFLIPHPYLIDNYSNQDFVWSFVFLKDISGTETNSDAVIMFHHFVMSPKGEILSYVSMKMAFFPNSEPAPIGRYSAPQKHNIIFGLEITTFIGITTVVFLIVIFATASILLYRKRRKKNVREIL